MYIYMRMRDVGDELARIDVQPEPYLDNYI